MPGKQVHQTQFKVHHAVKDGSKDLKEKPKEKKFPWSPKPLCHSDRTGGNR